MALVRNWRQIRFKDALEDVKREWKTLDLRGCKKIQIKFDPFRKDVKEIREFNHLIFSYDALKSNLNLPIRTEILCDRSEQSITVDLVNGEQLILKCSNLTLLDIFKAFNEYVTPLAPDDVNVVEVQTKAAKKKNRK